MIPRLWTALSEKEWQEERKCIREIQDRYTKEKGSEKE